VVHGIEGTQNAKVILKRNTTSGTLAVTLSRTGGTARTDNDFENFSNVTITFEDNNDTAEYIIVLKDDTVVENEKTITVQLSNPSTVDGVEQYQIDFAKRDVTILITDNESAPNVWIDSVVNGSEPDSGGKFILKRNTTSGTLAVTLSRTGGYCKNRQ
jgi:hypothetical protein